MENILHITVQEPDALTVTHLFPNSLKENGTHLFIKSHEWDEIVIDLTTDIPKGCLKYVGTCTKKLTVNVPGEIDTHIVQRSVTIDSVVEAIKKRYPNADIDAKIDEYRSMLLFIGETTPGETEEEKLLFLVNS